MVYGQAPPAGPQWLSRLALREPQALAYDKRLCASLDGHLAESRKILNDLWDRPIIQVARIR